jgi:hypothetical protein
MTGTICVQTSHSLSRSYLNNLVFCLLLSDVIRLALLSAKIKAFIISLDGLLHFLLIKSLRSVLFVCV